MRWVSLAPLALIAERCWFLVLRLLADRLQISGNSGVARLRKAIIAAVVMHLLLAAFMPELPKFVFTELTRNTGLNVFFMDPKEEETFVQSLNRPQPEPVLDTELNETSSPPANTERGADDTVTDDSPESLSDALEPTESAGRNEGQARSESVRIRFDHASVKLFVQQEATRYADRYPDQLAKFARSFRSFRSIKRRTPLESFQSRQGDVTVKASSSEGDICFKQEAQPNPGNVDIRTVLFFRCGEKPLNILQAEPE